MGSAPSNVYSSVCINGFKAELLKLPTHTLRVGTVSLIPHPDTSLVYRECHQKVGLPVGRVLALWSGGDVPTKVGRACEVFCGMCQALLCCIEISREDRNKQVDYGALGTQSHSLPWSWGRTEDWPEVPSPKNSGKLLRKTRVWNVRSPLPHGLPAKEELFWIIQPSPAIPATLRGG